MITEINRGIGVIIAIKFVDACSNVVKIMSLVNQKIKSTV